MTDGARALFVACAVLTLALVRLAVIAVKMDPGSPNRLISELRLAQFAALLLVLAAGVYIGSALVHESTAGSGLDVALAIGFLVIASVAMTQDPRLALTLLAIGFTAHAGVGLLHTAHALPADRLPDWYGTACAMYDIIVAGVCYLPVVRRP